MKISRSRLAPLLLLLWLLPACAELPGFPPPARNQEMARPDESLFLGRRGRLSPPAIHRSLAALPLLPGALSPGPPCHRGSPAGSRAARSPGELAGVPFDLPGHPGPAAGARGRPEGPLWDRPGLFQAGSVSRSLTDFGQLDRGRRPAPLHVVLDPGPAGGDRPEAE